MLKKRILIVTSELVPFHYGGIGTQFKSLASLLVRHGHRVSLLSRKPENFDKEIYRSQYGDVPLFFIEAPQFSSGPPHHFVYAAEVARRFDELYLEIRPDLVIFADFDAEGLFLLLQKGKGLYKDTEFLLTIQGMNHEVISVRNGDEQKISYNIMDLPDVRLLLAMEDLCIHLAPRIISLTTCAWEEIRQRLGINKTVRIIPNLIDPDLFHPDGEDVRVDLQEEPLILFVGRLDRMKGTDLLLKAYFEIVDQMYPLVPKIIFIGRDCFWNTYNSTFLEYWKDRIPEKYRDHVSFLGQVSHDHIRDYLKKATVCVFPSRWEPFGIVCLEALSMGCPVVVSKGTGLEEVLGPTLSEFAVPVTEDIQPLAQKILALLRGDVQVSSELLRQRVSEVLLQAEEGWLDLLREINRKEEKEGFGSHTLHAPLNQLLTSLDDSWRGVGHIQVYFRRRGSYAESDSLRVPYPRLRWTTLKIPLPVDAGERPLRLDPADAPGPIRIKQITFWDESEKEIWRADSTNRFRGCCISGKDSWSEKNECLVIEVETNDPQILIDFPVTARPVKMGVTLCAGDVISSSAWPV